MFNVEPKAADEKCFVRGLLALFLKKKALFYFVKKILDSRVTRGFSIMLRPNGMCPHNIHTIS